MALQVEGWQHMLIVQVRANSHRRCRCKAGILLVPVDKWAKVTGLVHGYAAIQVGTDMKLAL
jgi:hypothetical protein